MVEVLAMVVALASALAGSTLAIRWNCALRYLLCVPFTLYLLEWTPCFFLTLPLRVP